jgi:hypothetical protein
MVSKFQVVTHDYLVGALSTSELLESLRESQSDMQNSVSAMTSWRMERVSGEVTEDSA